MYCSKCGANLGNNTLCPYCDIPINPAYKPACEMPHTDTLAAQAGTVKAKIELAFSNKLFLTICILLTVTAVSFLITIFGAGLVTAVKDVVLQILFTVAAWMLYYTAVNRQGELSPGGVKLACGTVTALYVINWVAVGFFALLTLLSFSLRSFAGELINSGADYLLQLSSIPQVEWNYIQIVFIILSVALLFITAAIITINLLYYRNLKKFASSIRKSYAIGIWNIQKANIVRGWVLAGGILNLISAIAVTAIQSYLPLLPGFAGHTLYTFTLPAYFMPTAVHIITYIWITRYFYSTAAEAFPVSQPYPRIETYIRENH